MVVVYKRWNSASELSSRANRERVGLYGAILAPLSLIFIPIVFSVADAGMNLIEMEGFIL